MIDTAIFVPAFDNDGQLFPATAWHELEERLLQTFGGFTQREGVRGAWRSPSGRVYRDEHSEYSVVIKGWNSLPEWLSIAHWIRETWQQEEVYIKIAGIPDFLM